MDHYSILDQKPASQGTESGPESDLRASMAYSRTAAAGGIAETPRFPTEDGGHSLAEMARRDLDAALQLLAERAQYITGASGAAIALCRGGHNDMLCHASAGPNAPELGALLSAEFGLSGESVRTRLPLRCDDAERDTRVNREGCRQLGIASVVVMPIVSDGQVLGVFELFSGRVNAFDERDLSALQRLSEMVEAAIALTHSPLVVPVEVMGEFVAQFVEHEVVGDEVDSKNDGDEVLANEVVEGEAVEHEVVAHEGDEGDVLEAEEPAAKLETDAAPPDPPQAAVAEKTPIPVENLPAPDSAEKAPSPAEPAAPKKPLLWSAAPHTGPKPADADQSHVPPILRNLHKCQACGFPVSETRVLCVDCEEKQWRGQLRVSPPAQRKAAAQVAGKDGGGDAAVKAAESLARIKDNVRADRVPAAAITIPAAPPPSRAVSVPNTTPLAPPPPQKEGETRESALPLLSLGVPSSQAWFSANKYILGAIVVVAVTLAVIALLH